MNAPCHLRGLPVFIALWLSLCAALAAPVSWPDSVVKIERWSGDAATPRLSGAIAVAPDLLATILTDPAAGDSFRAAAPSGMVPVRILARDETSGFTLLEPLAGTGNAWPVVPLPPESPAMRPGEAMTMQSGNPAAARLAGRELLHGSRLLEFPWMRIHLPPGTWVQGTPLTFADGALAGLLAGNVPEITEAARMLPAAAVRHFVRLWTERRTLARAVLGMKLSPASGIPRVEECVAALPAERAGLQPGDVITRIGNTVIRDAADAAEACFYLRVDDPFTMEVLRGTETVNLTITPVSAAGKDKPQP